MAKRGYTLRDTVDWYNEQSGHPPRHNQKHPDSKKYWNEFKGIWCSKKTKKKPQSSGKLTAYNFQNYPIEKIKADFGNSHYQKVAMFITKIYQLQMGSYGATDWDYQYVDKKTLETFLGYHWPTVIDRLVSMDIVKVQISASKYDPLKFCRYFRLNKAFREYAASVSPEIPLMDSMYERSIIRHYKRTISERIGILKQIEHTLDNTALTLSNMSELYQKMWQNKLEELRAAVENTYTKETDRQKYISVLKSPEAYKKDYISALDNYYNYITRIHQTKHPDEKRALYNIKTSSFSNRISHMYSNAPRDFRKSLTIEGESVTEIDIRSSQPTFLFILFDKWYQSSNPYKGAAEAPLGYTERFKIANEAGLDIYKYMAFKMKGIKYVKDTLTRKEMKALFYRLVFGRPKGKIGIHDRKQLIGDLFGFDFYEFLSEMASKHIGIPLSSNHKNIAAILQREESSFLNHVMDKLTLAGISFLPLYDSLIVKKEDHRHVWSAFNEVIYDRKLGKVIMVS